MRRALPESPRALSTLEWPMPVPFLWAWLILVVSLWWGSAAREVTSQQSPLPPAGSSAITLMVTASALLGRFAAQVTETGFYVLWWKGWGRRLPFWRMLTWLISLSVIDLLAQSLAAIASHLPRAAAVWIAPWAGLRLFKPLMPSLGPGVWTAFGSLGLLTVTRVALTAITQSHALGMRLFLPLVLTTSTWFVTRILVWWCVDLVRGMSPLP